MTAVACFLVIRYGDHKFSVNKLMLAMYATLLAEEIFTLPFVFSWNVTLCGMAGFFHTYTGVANSIATGYLMMYFYCSSTCNERVPIAVSSFIRKHSMVSVFVFPLITVLPFSTNSFGRDGVWCRIQTDNDIGDIWTLFVYHFWIMVIMTVAVLMIFRSIVAACKIHFLIGGRLFSSIGSYSVVALTIWMFRTVVNIGQFFSSRDDRELLFVGELLIQLMGLFFSLILFLDMSLISDMRTGSEVFSKSSMLSTSVLNWENLLESLDISAKDVEAAQARETDEDEEVINPL